MSHRPSIAFFGTPALATTVLDTLAEHDLTPTLIISAPDQPVGRKQVLTPPPVATWATEHAIPLSQPTDIDTLDAALRERTWDVFVVFAYGRILPRSIIDLPRCGTVNLHPSLLPKLRGPSPIRSAILHDQRETGVTIMQMDEAVDHGPIIAQEAVTLPEESWPPYGPELDTRLVQTGADLLVRTLPDWCAGTLTATPQAHEAATYCKKLTREDGRLELDPYALPTGAQAYTILCRIRGLAGWPETYFVYNDVRIKIKAAHLDERDALTITRITPAGRSEMDFSAYFS